MSAAHASVTTGRRTSSTRQFVRHYLEMVVAMFLGMGVLGVPARWVLGAMGSSWSELTPSLMLLGMAFTMTAPMVGWMRFRGHGWRASAEMAASMLLPTFAAIALVLSGAVEDIDALLIAEHVAMLLAMLVAMLLRVDEYTHHAHGRSAVNAA